MALFDGARQALTRRSTRRQHQATIHVGMPLYVRDQHGRVVRLEVNSTSPASWVTERALIALDHSRDSGEYRLLLHGEPLHPRRSLDTNGVQHGDTLDLITADAARPRRHRRWFF